MKTEHVIIIIIVGGLVASILFGWVQINVTTIISFVILVFIVLISYFVYRMYVKGFVFKKLRKKWTIKDEIKELKEIKKYCKEVHGEDVLLAADSNKSYGSFYWEGKDGLDGAFIVEVQNRETSESRVVIKNLSNNIHSFLKGARLIDLMPQEMASTTFPARAKSETMQFLINSQALQAEIELTKTTETKLVKEEKKKPEKKYRGGYKRY